MTQMNLNGIIYKGDPDISAYEEEYAKNLRILHRRIRELEVENLGLRKRILSLQEAIEWKDHIIAIDEDKLRNKQRRFPSPDYGIQANSKRLFEAFEEYTSNLEEGLW